MIAAVAAAAAAAAAAVATAGAAAVAAALVAQQTTANAEFYYSPRNGKAAKWKTINEEGQKSKPERRSVKNDEKTHRTVKKRKKKAKSTRSGSDGINRLQMTPMSAIETKLRGLTYATEKKPITHFLQL